MLLSSNISRAPIHPLSTSAGNKGSVSAVAAENYWAAGPLKQHAVAQREADLVPLWTALHRAETPAAKAAAVEALAAETGRRAAVNRNVRSAVAALLLDPPTRTLLQVRFVQCYSRGQRKGGVQD